MLRMFGKPVKEVVKVDMAGKLQELGLAVHYPPSVWPPMAAVKDLAAKAKALVRQGQENPFVCVLLRMYVPMMVAMAH
jgi:hypothetical protein